MSELLSALEELRGEELSGLADARLESDFAELQRAGEMLEAERLRRLAEIERRGSFRRDGHLSAASWLAASFKVGWGQAKDQVRTARGLERMPETRKALEAGSCRCRRRGCSWPPGRLTPVPSHDVSPRSSMPPGSTR